MPVFIPELLYMIPDFFSFNQQIHDNSFVHFIFLFASWIES